MWDRLKGVALRLEVPSGAHHYRFCSRPPDLHRWAVFLLLQIGEHIQDTEMILVDRTLTDISFQNNVLLWVPHPCGSPLFLLGSNHVAAVEGRKRRREGESEEGREETKY